MKRSYIILIVLLGYCVASLAIITTISVSMLLSDDYVKFFNSLDEPSRSYWHIITTIPLWYIFPYAFWALLICSPYVFRKKAFRWLEKSAKRRNVVLVIGISTLVTIIMLFFPSTNMWGIYFFIPAIGAIISGIMLIILSCYSLSKKSKNS